MQVPEGVLIFEDPPLHTMHRGLLTRVFTPKKMTALEPLIRKFCADALDPLVEEGNAKAARAKYILGHLDAYLSATQFGVTLASLGLGWVGEDYISRLLQPVFLHLHVESPKLSHGLAIGLGFVFITFFQILFGELAPKYIAIRDPLGLALKLVKSSTASAKAAFSACSFPRLTRRARARACAVGFREPARLRRRLTLHESSTASLL